MYILDATPVLFAAAGPRKRAVTRSRTRGRTGREGAEGHRRRGGTVSCRAAVRHEAWQGDRKVRTGADWGVRDVSGGRGVRGVMAAHGGGLGF